MDLSVVSEQEEYMLQSSDVDGHEKRGKRRLWRTRENCKSKALAELDSRAPCWIHRLRIAALHLT
jgi:hypothetical protein